MHADKLKALIFLFIAASLMISGCGPGQIFGPTLTPLPTLTPTPAPLSDEEFAEAAREICQTLSVEYASADKLDEPSSRSTALAIAYRQAAAALDEIDIADESAPQGILLRTSLARLAEAEDVFWPAISEALDKVTEPGQRVTLIFVGGGQIYWVSSSTGPADLLDIDPQIVLEHNHAQDAVAGAAAALGLPDCSPWLK